MQAQLEIDFLYLDLTTCTRCRGTDANLGIALETTGDLLAKAGIETSVRSIHVETADQARELRFVSSPTIRVNGRDIALELRESSCGSEACTDGCGDSIACRVWVHEGREYTEPPVEMIVDAILREVYGGQQPSGSPLAEAYRLPQNLERFYEDKAAAGASAQEPAATECCSPTEQASCCDASEKSECCEANTEGTCGCR